MSRKLFADKLVMNSGRESGFKSNQSVVLGKMAPRNLVIPSARHGLRDLVERPIDVGVLAVARTMEIDGLYGTLQFLRNSPCCALLPLTTIADELDDLCYLSIASSNMPRRLSSTNLLTRDS